MVPAFFTICTWIFQFYDTVKLNLYYLCFICSGPFSMNVNSPWVLLSFLPSYQLVILYFITFLLILGQISWKSNITEKISCTINFYFYKYNLHISLYVFLVIQFLLSNSSISLFTAIFYLFISLFIYFFHRFKIIYDRNNLDLVPNLFIIYNYILYIFIYKYVFIH